MSEKKEPNEGTIPCMVCGEIKNYLNTSHMETHEPEKPQTIPEYRDWVADKSGLNRDHPAIDSNRNSGGRTNISLKGGESGN